MSEHPEQPSAAGEDHGADMRLATPGAITYLHIPAADVRQAAAFYRDVFGWHVHNPDSDRPSFDVPSGHLSGAWISDHLAATEPGLLPYIYVDQVEDTVAGSSLTEARSSPAPFPRDCSRSPPSATPPETSSDSGTTPHAKPRRGAPNPRTSPPASPADRNRARREIRAHPPGEATAKRRALETPRARPWGGRCQVAGRHRRAVNAPGSGGWSSALVRGVPVLPKAQLAYRRDGNGRAGGGSRPAADAVARPRLLNANEQHPTQYLAGG
jgi:uncharacterized protein